MVKRNTIQRQLVMSAVRFLTNHPTAEEVYDSSTMEYPDISKGTVYRNLNSLVESGLLGKVSVPSGADRFDHILSKHYHIKCTHCGNFMNVEDLDYFYDLDQKVGAVTSYKMEHHDIVFSGLCPECQKLKGTEAK
jgi:Fe2+ or Zn2+ uptake regulation protein